MQRANSAQNVQIPADGSVFDATELAMARAARRIWLVKVSIILWKYYLSTAIGKAKLCVHIAEVAF